MLVGQSDYGPMNVNLKSQTRCKSTALLFACLSFPSISHRVCHLLENVSTAPPARPKPKPDTRTSSASVVRPQVERLCERALTWQAPTPRCARAAVDRPPMALRSLSSAQLEQLDSLLLRQAFISGHEKPTAVDADAYKILTSGAIEEFPNVKRWFEHIKSYSKTGKLTTCPY